MDRFDAMRLFTRIVELGSFSRAAEQLGLPRASATLTIQRLEARLGVRLLARTTRHVRPTADGSAYYERCVAILAELEDAESAFLDAARKPQGRVRVDVSGSFARHVLMPALPSFFERHPRITIDISITDRQVDLVREGVDCVLRIGELRDSTLTGRRLGLLPQVSCASPAYLARHGTPADLGALDGHRTIEFMSPSTGRQVPLEFRVGERYEARHLPASVAVNNGSVYVGAAEAGFGIIQVPIYHVAHQLRDGTLVEVLPAARPPALPLSVLHAGGRRIAPRLRAFLDWLGALPLDTFVVVGAPPTRRGR